MPDTPDRTLAELLRGTIDLADDTLRVALYSTATAYTFDSAAHEFVSDVLDGGTTAQELQGTAGYTGASDRQTLANTTVTEDNTDSEAAFDGDNVTWSGVESAEEIQGWILYKQVGGDDSTPGDDPIILVADDGMADVSDLPLPTNGSDIELSPDPEGIINQVVQ